MWILEWYDSDNLGKDYHVEDIDDTMCPTAIRVIKHKEHLELLEQANKSEKEKTEHYKKAYNKEYEENKRLRNFIDAIRSQSDDWNQFCDCGIDEHYEDCMTMKIRKDEEKMEGN